MFNVSLTITVHMYLYTNVYVHVHVHVHVHVNVCRNEQVSHDYITSASLLAVLMDVLFCDP